MAHILVVDDEPSIRMLIKTILQAEGHEIVMASNGREALESVIVSVPDLIVLDMMMPEMDGWHFLEELHLRDLRRHTRIVIVSGHHDPIGSMAAQRTSARHFLAKPFEPTALVDMVTDAMSHDPEELFEQRDRTISLAKLMDRMGDVLGG
ncbi:MAG: response regulator [Actinomycetota bacterium]